MKATKFIAAAVVFVAAGSAFAADMQGAATPAANAAATAVAAAANAGIAVRNLNVPAETAGKASASDRTAVREQAVEFVKNHKTALAVQLEQYKN